jgi:hypothetical protein
MGNLDQEGAWYDNHKNRQSCISDASAIQTENVATRLLQTRSKGARHDSTQTDGRWGRDKAWKVPTVESCRNAARQIGSGDGCC